MHWCQYVTETYCCLGNNNNIVESLLLTQQYMSCKTPEHELLFDLLQKMMEYDSSKRITLEQAIAHPFFNPLRKERKWLGGDIEWTLLLPGRLLLTVSVCFKTACFITSVRIYFHFEYAGQIPLYFWQIKLECFECTPLVSIYFVILIYNSGLNIRTFTVHFLLLTFIHHWAVGKWTDSTMSLLQMAP